MTDDTPYRKDITFDDLIEDVFCLNIRGLKSLWALLVKPTSYFHAAGTPDWEDKYTPSIRLWFSIMAVAFFFKFFWAGENSAPVQFMEQTITAQEIDLPEDMSATEAALGISKWYMGYLPFAIMLGHFILGAVWPLWGRPVGFVVRERMIFAVVVPSTALSLVTLPVLGVIPAGYFFLFGIATSIITLLVDGGTAWRGAYAGITAAKRWWRVILLVLAINLVSLVMSVLAQLLGSITFFLLI